jgi:aspartyl-tRNA(Asn)/glutamyl-tRNA(Gln) amidotransferase subunit A
VAPRYGEGERTTLTKFTSLFNLVGRPALALPCGPAEEGLPASVQLSAPQGEDALVLAAGTVLERALRL